MKPLVVAVTGSPADRPKVIVRLKAYLTRRGFRVQLLESPRQEDLEEGDILLVSCGEKQAEQLARRLEEEWTDQWTDWYAALR